jgi:hypothetical protein
MKKTKVLSHYAVLALALTLLSSCKSSEEAAEPPINEVTGAPPVIWGDPDTSVVVDAQYLFLPEASDEDGDILVFSIENKPEWAEFETTTGQLQGVPGSDDVGEYQGIVISVTDDTSVVSLPGFAITVNPLPNDDPPPDDPPPSEAPTISGDPNGHVVAGQTYAFLPQASDPEGDSLSFSIINKPSWATFDTTTGRLQGEPTSSHLGESAPIELSVTDGTSISALPTFTITVDATGSESFTVSWIPPTENEDGSPLTDLAGYRIYYGMLPGEYTETVELDSAAGMTSHLLNNLAPGRYFLVMTSVNSQAMESRHSSELALEPTS